MKFKQLTITSYLIETVVKLKLMMAVLEKEKSASWITIIFKRIIVD